MSAPGEVEGSARTRRVAPRRGAGPPCSGVGDVRPEPQSAGHEVQNSAHWRLDPYLPFRTPGDVLACWVDPLENTFTLCTTSGSSLKSQRQLSCPRAGLVTVMPPLLTVTALFQFQPRSDRSNVVHTMIGRAKRLTTSTTAVTGPSAVVPFTTTSPGVLVALAGTASQVTATSSIEPSAVVSALTAAGRCGACRTCVAV